MPRKPNTTDRRNQIVAALLSVIARQGYEKATIQAIAQEAGLAPGLIHYHFKSKQEILVCLIQAIAAFAEARFAAAALGVDGARARLDAYLASRLATGEGASSEMVAAWVMIGAEAVRQPEVRALYQQVIADELAGLGALMHACLVERQRDPGGAAQIAAGLLAMVEGAFQLSSAAAQVMPAGYAVHAATAYAGFAIEAAPAG